VAELVFHKQGRPLLRLPIDRDVYRVGRGQENDFWLDDAALAREEAIFELRDDGWWIKDASGRGSRLDAAVVASEAPLTDGATLHLGGELTAVFRLGHPTTPGETRRHAGDTVVRPVSGFGPGSLNLGWTDVAGAHRLTLSPGDLAGLGTDEDNAIVLDDPYVSAFHARIYHHKGAWQLTDLESTNGTFVDGVRVKDATLAPGMRIRIGDVVLSIADDAPAREVAHRHGIVTGDPALAAVLDQVERLGKSDATVTLFGESGTGKELVARAVHDASDRSDGPFIPVNCAAISKELMESELFGHEKGAFTGATGARGGAFEEADGGTLFLDEVGELPLDVQAKLLRAIELKEIRRVGTSRPMQVDVRIVAATNRDLHAEVRAGRFREDLFYRLYVVPLTLPPLRRREGDVLRLTEHFLKVRSPGTPPSLSDEARKKILAHPWPGNVRELRNTIERAILFHRGDRLEAADITFPDPIAVAPEEGVIHAAGKTLADVEREAVEIALRANGGNRRLTAQALGIARSTLQAKLKELGILGDG
jgi:transcriptional regulator with AAA-type ATPase domain/pSer/pThr/pTyr-binding forkhead associated (FHA) protein